MGCISFERLNEFYKNKGLVKITKSLTIRNENPQILEYLACEAGRQTFANEKFKREHHKLYSHFDSVQAITGIPMLSWVLNHYHRRVKSILRRNKIIYS